MKLSLYLLVPVFFIAPLSAIACTFEAPSTSDIRAADFVAMARVDGTQWIPSTATLIANVQVYEDISGHSLTFLVAESPCALPIDRGEKVVVVGIYGEILALPADLYEGHFRMALEFAR